MAHTEIELELQKRLDPSNRRDDDVNGILGGSKHLRHLPVVECADGLRMSVQASYGHYCSPRDSVGPWHAVEIGFPTARVEQFMPFIDGDDSDPTDTVYGYVPLSIVADVIAEHGGFAA